MRGILQLIFLGIFVLSFAKEWTVKVRGQVVCNRQVVDNVAVELREHDILDPDDSFAFTRTDRNGYFSIKGRENEYTSISPYLRIIHDCDMPDRNGKKKCRRQSDYKIPTKAINADKEFDMDLINLNIKGHSEKQICD
uniref:Transthyretin-like family protein n=1 Tax=Panagrolaimus davidi TaxID=227884 RepID=A0A914QUF4_9BILA